MTTINIFVMHYNLQQISLCGNVVRILYILDWPTQTKTYLINVNARILIIYMKIMNSVASFLGDTFEKCLRSRGHYFLDLTSFWNRR